jgi:hypothetical protein
MALPFLFVAADMGVIEALASNGRLLQIFLLLGSTPQYLWEIGREIVDSIIFWFCSWLHE